MALTQVASGLIASVSGASLTGTQNIPKATLPTGSVLQVVQTVSNAQTGYTGTSFQTVSSLTTAITPTSATSKILITLSMTWGLQDNSYAFLKLQRNGSDISGAKGAPTGTQTAALMEIGVSLNGGTLQQHAYNSNYTYLDSPATTSSTSYSIVVAAQQSGSLTMYLNRGYSVSGDANNIAAISTMTLMEISA